MIALRRSLLAFFSVVGSALFAESSAPPPPPPQILLCYVLPFPESENGPPRPSGLDFTIPVEGKPAPLSLIAGGVSAPIIRPSAADFTLYKAMPPAAYSPPPGSPPQAPPPALGKASFPAEWDTVLLLIAADHSGNNIRLMPFNLGQKRLPKGSLGVFNLDERPYALRLGSSQGVVPPRDFATLNIPRLPDRDVGTYVLQIGHQEKGSWALSGRQTVSLDSSGRNVTILLPAGQATMPRLLHVPVPPPPPAPPEAKPSVQASAR